MSNENKKLTVSFSFGESLENCERACNYMMVSEKEYNDFSKLKGYDLYFDPYYYDDYKDGYEGERFETYGHPLYAQIEVPNPEDFHDIAERTVDIGSKEYAFKDFYKIDDDRLAEMLKIEESDDDSEAKEAFQNYMDDFEDNFDMNKFDDVTYPVLKAKILEQADARGLKVADLEFVWG